MTNTLTLGVLDEKYAINQLDLDSEIPQYVQNASFVCIVRTNKELSIIAREEIKIDAKKVDLGWRCFVVKELQPFYAVGIVAGISRVLAEAKLSIFAISTYDTDYFLVKDSDFEKARLALIENGHHVDMDL